MPARRPSRARLVSSWFVSSWFVLVALASPVQAQADYGAIDLPEVETLRLEPRPATILRGRAEWEEAYPTLVTALQETVAALGEAGLAPVGAALVAYLAVDDDGFDWALSAALPRAPTPEEADAAIAARPGLAFGTGPSGWALRLVHEGPYAEIDLAYEALTAHLDREGLVVDAVYLEELLTPERPADDPALRVGIVVFPD